MRLLLISLILSTGVFASIQEDRAFEEDYFIEVPDPKDTRDKSSWAMYKTDDCLRYNKSIGNEYELRAQGLRRCKDGSISFVQPKSTGAGGWEGKCGQTFGSNAMFTMCKKAVDPDNYFSKYMGDITPGVRPGTLRSGMSRAFTNEKDECPQDQARWIYYKLGNTKNYIKRLKQYIIPNYSHPNLISVSRGGKSYLRNPVATLIQNPGGSYLHWVTIIDMLEHKNACYFVVNHWDNQYQVPCETLASWSGRVGRTYPIILKSFSVVSFN